MDKKGQNFWFQMPFLEIETEWKIMEYALMPDIGASFYVDFFVNQSFRQPFRFLLIWKYNEIECWKVFLEKEKVGIQKAKIPLSSGDALFELIQELSLPIFVENSGEGRDGSLFQIKIGTSPNHLIFKWWDVSLPSAWAKLEDLSKMLLKFEKGIEYQKLSYKSYELDYEGEASLLGESKSFFLSFKTV